MKLEDLAINEIDILELGADAGQLVDRVLNYLLKMVVDGYARNEHDELLDEAKVYLNLVLNY